ncbi:MAG: response regulator [Candidatus Sedimenticola sp. 20ELBAFRAG]
MTIKSLLIVEGNLPLSQMLCIEFEEMGYRVSVAASCAQALELATGKHFDLALLDYNLPDGLGTELMAELCRMQPHLKIVLSSANPSAETAASNQCGVAFIRKPVGASVLNLRFKTALAHTAFNEKQDAAPGDTSSRF